MHEIIGRNSELKILQKALEEMENGRGNTIVIEGEHGVGKTYLCEVFEEYCTSKGVPFFSANAKNCEMERPYSTFSQILDSIRSAHNQMVPLGLTPFFNHREVVEIPDLRVAQSFLYEKVYNFIKSINEGQGIVLFFDSVEWIDASSNGLLHYLAMKARQTSILILCTFTPEDILVNRNERVKDTLFALANEKLCTRVRISNLTREDTIELVKLYLKNSTKQTGEKIYEITRGNPQLIKNVCELIERNPKINLYELTPDMLKISYDTKFSGLGGRAEEIARIASVIGKAFDMQTMSRLTQKNEEELLEYFEELIAYEVIEETDEGYMFKTPLVRAYFYSKIPDNQRTELHRTVAEYIARSIPRKEEEVNKKIYQLAYHYYHGKQYELALRYLLRSAELAYEQYGFEQSLEFLKMAEMCANNIGNMFVKLEIKTKIGDIQYGLGNFEEATKIYSSMLNEQIAMSDGKVYSELNRKMGMLANLRTEYWEALKYYEKALEVAKNSKHIYEIAMAHRGAGYIYLRLGNWRKALDEYMQAMGMADKVKDPLLTGIIFLEMGNIYNMRGNLEDAIMHYTMAIKNLTNAKNYLDIARAFCNMGDVYVQKEDYSTANEKFALAIDYANKTGNESFLQWVEVNRGFALIKMGYIDDARKKCYAFIETCRANKNRFGTARAFRVLGWAEREDKHYMEALEFFNLALEILESLAVPYEIGRELYDIGLTYEKMDEMEKARSHYARALEILSSIGAGYYTKKLKIKLGRE